MKLLCKYNTLLLKYEILKNNVRKDIEKLIEKTEEYEISLEMEKQKNKSLRKQIKKLKEQNMFLMEERKKVK